MSDLSENEERREIAQPLPKEGGLTVSRLRASRQYPPPRLSHVPYLCARGLHPEFEEGSERGVGQTKRRDTSNRLLP